MACYNEFVPPDDFPFIYEGTSMRCPYCQRTLTRAGTWCTVCQRGVVRWPLVAILVTVLLALAVWGLTADGFQF